jgi:hypothetical protein
MMDDFSYEPMTEEQAQQERYSLLKEGEYEATVEKFEGKMSSTNNRMIVLSLNVYDKAGIVHQMTDYLPLTPKMAWKLINHCKSGGLFAEYENKTWRPQMSVGKMFCVKVAVEPGSKIPTDKLKGKPEGSVYPDRNVIRDYVKQQEGAANPANVAKSDFINDDIPW